MAHTITDQTIQTIAGSIEALLIEQREGIAFAYRKIPDGIKLTIGVNLDPTSQGVQASYSVSYPLEPKNEPTQKQTVKKTEIINDTAPLFDTAVVVTPEKVRAMLGAAGKTYKMEPK
ncbi:MAG: hypothetical protein ACYDG4_13340 [Desulfuromonadaceae bacterium]